MSGAITTFFGLARTIDRVLPSALRAALNGEQMREALSEEQRALTIGLAGRPDLAKVLLLSSQSTFLSALRHSSSIPGEQGSVDLLLEIEIAHNGYLAATNRLFQMIPKDTRARAEKLYQTSVAPYLERLIGDIDRYIALNQKRIQDAEARVSKEAQIATRNSVLVTILALVLALFLTYTMVRRALTPLALLAKQAETIGGGDLTRRIDLRRSDEIGALAESFNAMAGNLAELRKREIRRLQRAERMTDVALESMYDPVIVTDAQARIVHLNSSAEAIFGPAPVQPRVAVGNHIPDRRVVRAVQRALSEEAVPTEEDEAAMVPLQVQGTARTYRLRATQMRTDDSLLLGAVVVLEDVTHLKELDRLKNEFIGVASHELRTPVTSLLLSVQLMEEGAAGPLNPQQKELVQAQKADLERLERLMRELLDITRLEAGTAVPKFSLVQPSELLGLAEAALRTKAEASQVELKIEELPNLPFVRADRSQIQRILVNLIDNAIRHTPPGGHVWLRAERQGDDVLFQVRDSGQGIPKDYVGKVFERFVQVPGATQGGAGLGLSIVQTIVKAHGGKVSVDSELGKGSIFSFTLQSDAVHSSENESGPFSELGPTREPRTS
jgi:NtrC-family two-component system sensor histidine kinase KinB